MSEKIAVPQVSSMRFSEPAPSLGQYELLHEIASGGMATVYLARKRGVGRFERLVAIKCCHPHLRRDPAFVTMFLDEARLAARIHHPNVVATLEVSDESALYFVMEYVEGLSLAEWLSRLLGRKRRIAEELLLRVMIDALSGLHAAHELKDHDEKPFQLVHRDVSPQNLLIGVDGVTRIADFGIAKAETRTTRTRTGQVKGKTGYMPPEQILGEPLDRRADVYAAGVVLWEALVGRRLFDGESDAATINQVLNGEIPAPSTVTEVSVAWDAIVRRALQFQADARYATALDFARALEQSGLSITSHRAVGEAVGELCHEQKTCLRNEALRQSTGDLTLPRAPPSSDAQPIAESPGLGKSRRLWIGIGVLGVALLIAGYWALKSRHPKPARLAVAPIVPMVLTTPASSPVFPPKESPASIGSSETPMPRPGRTSRPRRLALPTAQSSEPAPARATSDIATPLAPVASVPRPRAKPSEFRPSDL